MATFGGQASVGTSVETGEIEDGAVTNVKVNASAAIAHSKMESDARARANHTGTQAVSTLSDFPATASQGEAEAGSETALRSFTPQRIKQAIDAIAGGSVDTYKSKPVAPLALVDPQQAGYTGNTTLQVGRIFVPIKILQVVKFSFFVATVGAAGTLKITLFSQDGQTQIFTFTTASISSTGLKTTVISAVDIPAGDYYITVLPVSTANLTVYAWNVADQNLDTIAGEPEFSGTLTVTADTVPATIDPTALAANTLGTLSFNLNK